MALSIKTEIGKKKYGSRSSSIDSCDDNGRAITAAAASASDSSDKD